MRTRLFWLITTGIIIISAVILIQLVATIVYLRSPERVVGGSFQKLVDAKNFSFSLKAIDNRDELNVTLDGNIDLKAPTKPVGRSSFVFTYGEGYSLKGQLSAVDGKVYGKLDESRGIPENLARAFSSWVGLEADALYLAASDNAVSLKSYLNDGDISEIFAALRRHPLYRPVGQGTDEILDNVYVVRYPVIFDKGQAILFINDLEIMLKDQGVSHERFNVARKALSGKDEWDGDVWVAKNDGTLRAARLVFPTGDRDIALTASLYDYDKKAEGSAPATFTPLPNLLRNLYLPDLNLGVPIAEAKIPFPEIVVPLMNIPELPPEENQGLNLQAPQYKASGGGPIDFLLRLIYGDNPYSLDPGVEGAKSIFNVNTQ